MSFTKDPLTPYLVEKVGDAVINEVKFLLGVKDEVDEMQIELRWMQSFLDDADRLDVRTETSVDRQKVSDVREQSLDAKDAVDTYLVKLALRKRGGQFSFIKRFVYFVKDSRYIHKVGSDIEAVKSKLARLNTRLQTYGMSKDHRVGEASSSSFGQALLWRRRTYGHIKDPNVVGLNGKTEEVVDLLLRKEEPCRVVSIYGMGGLGKTTLAIQVYHNDKITSHFDKFVWMYVSQQFKPRDVLEAIYAELTSPSHEQQKEIEKLKDNQIVSRLYQVQKDHKCFIVLDDIWRIEDWDLLSAAFPKEVPATGSKILLTTRNRDLAEHVDGRGSYGGLEHLNSDQSWELLQKIAFAGRDNIEDKESKENFGKKMIEHCTGLPLAIVVLAGILATKKKWRDWETVHDNIRTYLRRGRGNNKEQCLGVDGVLSLSYYDLPIELKPCFLYLSQFPEDYEIETNRLLKMWMAEGFVRIQDDGEGEEMIEDAAERYLNELVGRCMIQVGEEGSTGRIKTCRMHDLMRDMCLSKAKDENFIFGIGKNTVGKVRRLSLFPERGHRVFHYRRNYQLRSLILYRHIESLTSARMISKFKLLRMLVLERIYIQDEDFIKEIGNLILLIYLSLRESYVVCFPSMEKLRCLETLDLRIKQMRSTCCFPNINEIWKMKSLRHLYLPRDVGQTIARGEEEHIGVENENVQTLVNFPPPNCPPSEVVNFPKVRKLQIAGSKNPEEFGELFRHKKVEFRRLSSLHLLAGEDRDFVKKNGDFEKINLEGMLIGCPNLYKLRIAGCLVNFPVYQLVKKLTKLTLVASQIEDPKYIEAVLGKLPNLRILHLRSSFNGRELCFERGSFLQLKMLRLVFLHNLEEWKVDKGAMPNLQYLEITECGKLEMVPEGLRFIATLKELHYRYMPRSFKQRANKGGADFYKIQHVSTVVSK